MIRVTVLHAPTTPFWGVAGLHALLQGAGRRTERSATRTVDDEGGQTAQCREPSRRGAPQRTGRQMEISTFSFSSFPFRSRLRSELFDACSNLMSMPSLICSHLHRCHQKVLCCTTVHPIRYFTRCVQFLSRSPFSLCSVKMIELLCADGSSEVDRVSWFMYHDR